MEEADKERALKEVSEANLRDLGTTLATTERRATEAKTACTLAEQRAAGLEGKLGEVEMKLTQAERLIFAQNKEMADLKATVAKSEDKFYNMGFANAENSKEPIMVESQWYRFRDGWMAAVNAMGLLEDYAFRDLEQIPYPEGLICPSVQTTNRLEEEDSLSMRELVEEIDSHAKVIELDGSTNPTAVEDQVPPSTLSNPDLQTTSGTSTNLVDLALILEA